MRSDTCLENTRLHRQMHREKKRGLDRSHQVAVERVQKGFCLHFEEETYRKVPG